MIQHYLKNLLLKMYTEKLYTRSWFQFIHRKKNENLNGLVDDQIVCLKSQFRYTITGIRVHSLHPFTTMLSWIRGAQRILTRITMRFEKQL